ncbi:MAG: nucleoside hydrolase [Candidatus Hodarchaeota archaeon]
MSRYKVIIDCDPGLGKRAAEVDDGLAIFLMLNNPDIFDIIGITTVYGNTPVEVGYKLVKKYLKLANRREIPNFKGATSRYTLGTLTDASRFIISKIQEYEHEIILLTLGPLTNIATIFMEFPNLIEKIKKIIFIGGTIEPTSAFSPPFIFEDGLSELVEFNFQNDPMAAKVMFDTETLIPRIGLGLDICCQAVFKEEHLERIKSVKSPITNFIVENSEGWLNVWKFNKSEGFYPFDVFVPIYMLNPELFTTIDLYITIDTDETPGRIIKLKSKHKNIAPVTFCMNFQRSDGNKQFMEILIENLIKTE